MPNPEFVLTATGEVLDAMCVAGILARATSTNDRYAHDSYTAEFYGELLQALDWLVSGNAPSELDTYGVPVTYTDVALAAYKEARNA